MSTVLFKAILQDILAKDPEYKIKPDSSEAKFIFNLIEGKPQKSPDEKQFLFDIVSNSRNSIDVDKLDYILRDCRCINLACFINFNPALLTNFVLPIDGQICYPIAYDMEIGKLFKTRWDLHKDCYNHPTIHAYDLLICDVLLLAN